MSLLESIKKGREQVPPRIMLYGVEGVGKSTFASEAPKPIFIQTEDGLGEIECDKFPMATQFDHVLAYLEALANDDHDYQTVVIDSLDWLERIIHEDVCERDNAKSIVLVAGGYGKGYELALSYWREIVHRLQRLREKKQMAVIGIAHAKVERFEDPESAAYDRYTPRLHKSSCALWSEWADAVLFATRKFRVSKDTASRKERTIASAVGKEGGERVLRCIGSPACIAKNRYQLPEEIPLSWESFVSNLNRKGL